MREFKKVEGQWIVPETTELFGLIIAPGAEILPPEGKTLVFTWNGRSMPLKPGNYEGDVVLEVLDPIPVNNYKFRAAIYAEGGTVIEEKSALSAVTDGEIKDGESIDAVIESQDENFNGIMVGGKGPYTVSGADISLQGNGGNDFIGYGAGITAADDAVLTVEDSFVATQGAARGAVFAGGHSKLYVRNCEITAQDGVLPADYEDNVMPGNMRRVPWMLGLRGNCRATNLADFADAWYEDCTLTSEAWGVMSTDGVRRCRLSLKNCDVAITGPSGYGAFSIGDCIDTFEDCRFDVPDYALIMANETASGVFRNTKVDSGRFGVMSFRNEGGKLTITDGSVFNTDETAILVKGCAPIIEADSSVIAPGNGIILQVINSDDPGSPTGYYIDPREDDVFDPAHDNTVARETYDVIATFKDMTVNGDFYNGSTGQKGDTGPKAPMGPPPGMVMPSPEEKRKQWKTMVENLGRYHRAGGRVVIGTDLIHSRDFMKDAVIPVPELRALTGAGFTLQEAIAAGTITAAEVVGTGKEEGLIEEGRLANLVAVSGPVDESFAALDRENIRLVLHRGAVIRSEL